MLKHVAIVREILETKSISDLMLSIQTYESTIFKHSVNVAYITAVILDYIDVEVSEKEIEIIKGALLHDIGKMSISKKILMSAEKLTNEEYADVKLHAQASAMYAKKCGFSKIVCDICEMHHEKLDGSGYPSGKDIIPFYVQIVTTADIYDALVSVRPYKKTYSCQEALKQLKAEMIQGKLNMEPILLLEKACMENAIKLPYGKEPLKKAE